MVSAAKFTTAFESQAKAVSPWSTSKASYRHGELAIARRLL